MSAKTEKLSITVPKELAEKLREMVSSGKISAFVADAVDDKLQMEKQKIGLEVGRGAWEDEDHPDLKTPEDTQRFIREIRNRDLERLEMRNSVFNTSGL